MFSCNGFKLKIFKGTKGNYKPIQNYQIMKMLLYRLGWGTFDRSYYDLQHPCCDAVLQQYPPTWSK